MDACIYANIYIFIYISNIYILFYLCGLLGKAQHRGYPGICVWGLILSVLRKPYGVLCTESGAATCRTSLYTLCYHSNSYTNILNQLFNLYS